MNAAVDIYKQQLPKPKGMMNYFHHNGSQNLIHKIKQRNQQDRGKLKMAGAASLVRDSNCTSELAQLGQQQITHNSEKKDQQNNSSLMNKGGQINNNVSNTNIVNGISPSNRLSIQQTSQAPNQQNLQQQSNNKHVLLISSRNLSSVQNTAVNNTIVQAQQAQQRLVKNQSRNNIEKRQSISFDKQAKPQIESVLIAKNPYLASTKASQNKRPTQTNAQKFKDKSYSILTNNNTGINNNNNNSGSGGGINKRFAGLEPKTNKNGSERTSPRNCNPHIQSQDHSVNLGYHRIFDIEKLPNLRQHEQKSLERNNSVFSRKELIKQEYNRIIENRLPNILSLMNHDKHFISANDQQIHHMDYDDTDLLSKMFSKDQNKSGNIQSNELQVSLQNKHDKRYNHKQQFKNSREHQLSSSHSQDRIYGEEKEKEPKIKTHHNQHTDYKKTLPHHANSVQMKQIASQAGTTMEPDFKDDDLLKLDKLQLINVSARFELLSANQQLLDFHLNRLMNNKQKKKKILQNAGEKSLLQGTNMHQQQIEQSSNNNYYVNNNKNNSKNKMMNVVEDFENESGGEGSSTLCYEDKLEKTKKDRIKQLGDPHSIIQDRLNSMNPLTFGDTIRLPGLNVSQISNYQ